MIKKGRQGEGGGRPPKYANEDDLAKKILAYSVQCSEKKELPNKAGLCVFLGISRDTYGEYKKKYPDTIKGNEVWIENAWVQRLAGNAPTGAIFYLKNAFKENYKDKHESDVTSGGKPIPLLNVLQHNSNQEGRKAE